MTKAAFFVFQFHASVTRSSIVVSEYFNGRPIDRYYIGFTSSEILITLHWTSFTISLPPVLKLLITKITKIAKVLPASYCRTVKIGDRCSSLKSLNSKVMIYGRGAFAEGIQKALVGKLAK